MRIASLDIPAVQDRISAADYRRLMQRAGAASYQVKQDGQRWQYNSRAIKALPDSMPAAAFSDLVQASRTEHEEQSDLVQWLRLKEIRHFAVPNGNLRSRGVAGQLAAEGVSPGVSDLVILPEAGEDDQRLPIVFLEMKRSRGGRLSDDQREFLGHIEALAGCGYPVVSRVAAGFQAARGILMDIGYGEE
jgi:hypothetical protein